jgi:hypothetical protein
MRHLISFYLSSLHALVPSFSWQHSSCIVLWLVDMRDTDASTSERTSCHKVSPFCNLSILSLDSSRTILSVHHLSWTLFFTFDCFVLTATSLVLFCQVTRCVSTGPYFVFSFSFRFDTIIKCLVGWNIFAHHHFLQDQ